MNRKNISTSLIVKLPLALALVGFTLSAQARPPERVHNSWNNRNTHTTEVYVERYVQVVHPRTITQRHGFNGYSYNGNGYGVHQSNNRVDHRNFRRGHTGSQVNIVIPLNRGDHRVRRHSQKRWSHG